MARGLSESKAKKLQKAAAKAEAKKLESQKKQGKGFVNLGQGIIPESVWKNLPGKVGK